MDGFVSEGGVCLHRILPVDTVRLTPFTVVVIVLLLSYVRQVNSSLSLGQLIGEMRGCWVVPVKLSRRVAFFCFSLTSND
jgi:hypothetical protein